MLSRQHFYLGLAFLLAKGCSRAGSCRCTAFSWKLDNGGYAYAWGLGSMGIWGSCLPRPLLRPLLPILPPWPAGSFIPRGNPFTAHVGLHASASILADGGLQCTLEAIRNL